VVDRRAFIRAGLVLPTASYVAGVALPFTGQAAERKTLQLERFVFDARFAEAADAARHVADFGVELAPIAGDLTELWYSEFDLRWKEAPMALAGVTTHEGLFVLETLAMDHRMRVVYRGEHRVVHNDSIEHKLAGPAPMLEPLSSLPYDTAWEAALSLAMTQCPLGQPKPAQAAFVTRVNGISLRDVPLYSWIIAPRAAVALTLGSQ
jgi:hypothetical protein